MKKFLLSGLIVVFASTCLFGQLVTNTNQSAIYYRLLSRNGTIDLDAVYYNPGGLAFMKDGWLQVDSGKLFVKKPGAMV